MQLHLKNKSISIFDSYLFPNALRIQVHAIYNLEKINNQYFIRRKSLRNIYNYYREIGAKSVIQKVISRLRETIRNEKYCSVGIGKTCVAFFAVGTAHPT